jgi:hypothetical protein
MKTQILKLFQETFSQLEAVYYSLKDLLQCYAVPTELKRLGDTKQEKIKLLWFPVA